ncbi:hypothetical protein CXG81DRAFT_15395 [Caulochytrium protostelioides]|uniref:HCP-like protein n=1 Tax=Caulochytrium protostelioides TaxID=1555241 RepID=A0A4P9WZ78_9FUNG|nr:hypothetical protein CXG81DRAFT_15395 [Caulochytrium protostelioides]|eukprot:RKO98821.1 hypothetical protein CXG81DRAFT_15395 [Caulochytrium protostelioides]
MRRQLCETAVKKLKKLALMQVPEAQFLLANLYIDGIPGYQKDHQSNYAKAFALYYSAARRGNEEALFHVALSYEQGAGVTLNKAKALQYYRKAAIGNHPGAMLRLAMALIHGELGQSPNARDGAKWLRLAAKYANTKYPHPLYEYAMCHEEGIDNILWPDHAYLVELLSEAATLGHVHAQYKLGSAYEYGNWGLTPDPEKSIGYYTVAAENGHLEAMFELAGWYLTGARADTYEMAADPQRAIHLVMQSAERGLAKSMFALGYFYEEGLSLPRDMRLAQQWYLAAAEKQDARAIQRCVELGLMPGGRHKPKKSGHAGCRVM